MQMKDKRVAACEVDVLIVGAGPVGLAAAIELGQRGAKVRIVEANARVGNAPRAKTTNVRTCEHLRRWGLIDALRAKAPFGVDYPSTVCFATRLAGRPITAFENAFYCRPGQNPLYAEHAQWIPQYKLEEVLQDHVLAQPGVRLSFGTRLEAFTHDIDGVTAVLEGDSGAESVRARYLIGADGARSTVRRLLGIRMEGSGGLSRNRMIVFRQPGLEAMHGLPRAVMYWLVNADSPAVMGPLDTGDRWYIGGPVSALTEDPVRFIRGATGLDISPEILSVDDWEAHQLLAERYREGRVFLAGDACHLHPPYGGYGMNLGIGDAVDLGWKLAATLQGWGGDGLMDSYERERRPVHRRVVDEAVLNHATRTTNLCVPDIETDGPAGDAAREAVAAQVCAAKAREFDSLGVVLGYRYTDSPLIEDGTGNGADCHPGDFVPSAAPGCRAPHAWLAEGTGSGASLYDTFGGGFTLLVLDDSADTAAALEAAAARQGCPLTIVRLDNPHVRALYGARYALIRPDQHVAWRADAPPPDPEALLRRVTGHG